MNPFQNKGKLSSPTAPESTAVPTAPEVPQVPEFPESTADAIPKATPDTPNVLNLPNNKDKPKMPVPDALKPSAPDSPDAPDADPKMPVAGEPMKDLTSLDPDLKGLDVLHAMRDTLSSAQVMGREIQPLIINGFTMKPNVKGRGDQKGFVLDEDGNQTYKKPEFPVSANISMSSTQLGTVQRIASELAIQSIFGPLIKKYFNRQRRTALVPTDIVPSNVTWSLDSIARHLGHDISDIEGLEALIKYLFTHAYAPKPENIAANTEAEVCGLSEGSDLKLSEAHDIICHILEDAAKKVAFYGGVVTKAQALSLSKWFARGGTGRAPAGGSLAVSKALAVFDAKLTFADKTIHVLAGYLQSGKNHLNQVLNEDDLIDIEKKVENLTKVKDRYGIIVCTLTSYRGVLTAQESVSKEKSNKKRKAAIAKAANGSSEDILGDLNLII